LAATDAVIESESIDVLGKKVWNAAEKAMQERPVRLMKAKARKDQHRVMN
jgi:hypothetical protein